MSRSFSPQRRRQGDHRENHRDKAYQKKIHIENPKMGAGRSSTLTYLDDPLCDLPVFSSVVKKLEQVILQCWRCKQLGSY